MAGNIRLTKAVMRVFRGAGKEAPALVLEPTFAANSRTTGYFLGDLLATFLDCLSWKYSVPIYPFFRYNETRVTIISGTCAALAPLT